MSRTLPTTAVTTHAIDSEDPLGLGGPPIPEPWRWQRDAACRDMDSEIFFHPDWERGPARARREATAKAVCQSCPVVEQCRAHGLTFQEPYGVWGGLSRHDRDRITG